MMMMMMMMMVMKSLRGGGGCENVRKTEMERGKRVAGKDIEPNRTPCFERHKRGT